MAQKSSVWRRGARLLLQRKSALAGAVIMLLFTLIALLAPWISPHDPLKQDLNLVLQAPSATHLFGTDDFGRDILSRVIWGSRISLTVGLIAVGIGLIVGTTLGAIAGYKGGWLDYLILGVADTVWAFPEILLAIALVAILQPGLGSAMIALGIVTWPQYARVARGQFMALRNQDFVVAAKSLGARDLRLIWTHILPNALSPLIVLATMGMAGAILVEASLSFLGLGAQPPQPSWGAMLSAGRTFIYQAPWLTFIPGGAIMLTVLGFNLLGDALRDLLDPRHRT
ncbi:MAG: ABC-type dipeptide/oligopeptide/nickel transport system, permease component [Firmicutes bacterium]|nr:ABC-type dipeptide/oligopeptide/nickel transport system, permease component [Bacillota bacterium]